MTELLHQVNELVRFIASLLYFLPYWTSTFLLFVAVLWLHLKLRSMSTLSMAVGYGLAAGSMGYSFIASDVLNELLTNLGFVGFWLGALGTLWFVSTVKQRHAPSKPLNTDAGDAGAG